MCTNCADFINKSVISNWAKLSGVAILTSLQTLHWIPHRNLKESIGFLHLAHHFFRPFPYMHHDKRLFKPTPSPSMANKHKDSTI